MRITWRDILHELLDVKTVTPSRPPHPISTNKQVTIRPPAPVTPKQTPMKVHTPPPVAQQTPVVTNIPVTPVAPREINKMNSDSFFVIGTGHDVCQDYVAHHNNGVKSYVVLADGCSGSKDSDVGARVLVKTHELYIPRMGIMDFNEFARRSPDIYSKVIEEAESNAKALELDAMALDATLLSIISNKTGEFMVTCYGDGVVALGRHDGVIEVYSVSYRDGYPNYLSYQLSPERKARFDEKTSNFREMTYELIDENDTLKQVYRSGAIFDTYLGTKKKYCWVAVISDGVQSFVQKNITETSVTTEPVPSHEVIREMFAFKNFNGTFVKRRVKRFLELCKERGWTHYDDLYVGVVYLGSENE